ncbi:hypothetical protein ACWCOV_12580 [Kribbella sp. NPDC002412]
MPALKLLAASLPKLDLDDILPNLAFEPPLAKLDFQPALPALDLLAASLPKLDLDDILPNLELLAASLPKLDFDIKSLADSMSQALLTLSARVAQQSESSPLAPDQPRVHAVQPLGLTRYQVEALIFLMIFICMLSARWTDIVGSGVPLSDRAVACTDVIGVAGLPKAITLMFQALITFLRD